MFLHLLLTLTTAESIFSKGYQQMNGQVNIEIDIFKKFELAENQKLIITLSDYNSNKLPLFLICKKTPSFLKIPDYSQIKNNECVADLYSYDYKKSFQTIIIKLFEQSDNYMNIIHQQNLTKTNIIVMLEQISDFFIKFDIVDKNVCYLKCQNQGLCIYGQCKCIEDYIGNDCSIQIFDLKKQGQLDPNVIYYLNINESTSLRFDFYKKCYFLFKCMSDQPFYQKEQLQFQSFIQISTEDSQNCIKEINLYNKQFFLHQQSLYLFSTFNLVQINTNTSQNSDINIIIYILLSVSFSLLIIIIFAYFKFKKRNLRNSLNKSKKKGFFKQMNKFMLNETYEELIKKFPGLSGDKLCQICLEDYNKDDKIILCYCTHHFHIECLNLWIENHQSCPTCRSSLINYDTLTNDNKCLYQTINSSKDTYQPQQKLRLFGEIQSCSSPKMKI